MGAAARRHDRRSSTPSATASTCSTRSRRSPAAASTRTSTASAASRTTCPRAGSTRPSGVMAEDPRRSATRWKTSHRQRDLRRPAPAASASSRADVGLSLRPVGRQPPGQSGVDWDLRRDSDLRRSSYDQLDWKVWTHPDGDSFARYWVRLQETREATQDRRPAARRPARRARSWPRSPASSRCRRARPTSRPRTRSARWATTSSARATSARSGSRSARASFNNISIVAVGAARRLRARRHHDPRQPLLHPRGHRPVSARRRARLLAADDPRERRRAGSPCCCRPARSSTSSCSR